LGELRIGVFVCHCGNNIAGVIDVESVVEYVKTLPDVVHAENNLYTCSEDGLTFIKKAIGEHELNRVIVAACTPRTHEPLFKKTCQQAGLNRYLFEFVNIREHCSWIHSALKEEATEKAKKLIRMGVAKARLLEPLIEHEMPINPSSLVIGGGVAGMNAALSLANQGFDVHLVEKEEELGGNLSKLHKVFPSNEDADKIISPFISQVTIHENIKLHLATIVKDVSGYVGNFSAVLVEKKEKKEEEITIGTILVAIGAEELKPKALLNFGEMKNVITQGELELKLKSGEYKGEKIVMINCAGARIPERPYCSRICCMNSIKNASLIKESFPEAEVHVLHRDIMAYGSEFEEYYQKAMKTGVKFLRYDLDSMPKVIGNEKAGKVSIKDTLFDGDIELLVDFVVLSTPLIPREDNQVISKVLKVPLGREKFFLEAHVKLRPVEFATDGIFICGSARWSSTIPECISQSYAAASKALALMRKGKIMAEAITAFVDDEECIGCGNCIASCPYNAITLKEVDNRNIAEVNPAQCKSCGTCVPSCNNGAIQQYGFTDRQLLTMINALTESEEVSQ
jgi:heterodisulfide reductase subunit A